MRKLKFFSMFALLALVMLLFASASTPSTFAQEPSEKSSECSQAKECEALPQLEISEELTSEAAKMAEEFEKLEETAKESSPYIRGRSYTYSGNHRVAVFKYVNGRWVYQFRRNLSDYGDKYRFYSISPGTYVLGAAPGSGRYYYPCSRVFNINGDSVWKNCRL